MNDNANYVLKEIFEAEREEEERNMNVNRLFELQSSRNLAVEKQIFRDVVKLSVEPRFMRESVSSIPVLISARFLLHRSRSGCFRFD